MSARLVCAMTVAMVGWAGGGPVHAEELSLTDARDLSIGLYRRCVTEEAIRLEGLGGPLPTIVAAADAFCREDRQRAMEFSAVWAMKSRGMATKEAAEVSKEMLELIDAKLHPQVLEKIAVARAERQSEGK